MNDTELLLVEVLQGKRVLRSILLPANVNELERLLEVLWQAGLTSVWVMPGTNLSRIATCAWFEQASLHWVVVTHSAPNEPTRPNSVLLWPKGSGQGEVRRLTFIFPEYAGWNWELSDTKSLLATVTYLEQALARVIVDSPKLIAHQLLTDLTLDQSFSYCCPTTKLDTLHSGASTTIPMMGSSRDVIWLRPLTLSEQRQRYLHKYSHLSRYLEACMAVKLGGGTPTYSPNGRAYDGIRPGIWRTHIERAGSVFDNKHLPACADGEWMSTPQIKCCQDISYHVYVQEGYYWPQGHEVLSQWARALWQATESIHTHPQRFGHAQAKANAFRTIKQLVQLGLASMVKEQNEGGRGRLDWWTQIAGRSRAVLFTHLAGLARKGTMPVLVEGDALWVVSDDPNPLTAVPGLVAIQRWKGYIVGYKVPLPLSGEVKAALGGADDPGLVAMALDTLAGETSPSIGGV